MWIQLILYYIIGLVVFPRYVGSCIWFLIGLLIFSTGFKGYQQSPKINAQLTEAVCNIDARKETITEPSANSHCYSSDKGKYPCPSTSCVTFDVSYAVGAQTYSGAAYSLPPDEPCFGDQAFEVNNQYYCWYLTKNPGVVYLNKVDTLNQRGNIFYGLIILILSSSRLLYLIFKKPDKPEVPNEYQRKTVLEFVQETPLFAIIGFLAGRFAIGSFMFVGAVFMFVGLSIMLSSINSSINGKEYLAATCTIKEVQPEKARLKLKVSYPVRQLTYTVWSKNRVKANYGVGQTIPCWYSSASPQQVTFNAGVNEDSDSYYAGVMFAIVGGLIFLVAWMFNKGVDSITPRL